MGLDLARFPHFSLIFLFLPLRTHFLPFSVLLARTFSIATKELTQSLYARFVSWHYICEVAYNVLYGNIPLDEYYLKYFKTQKFTLRKQLNTEMNWEKKEESLNI